MTRRFLTDHGTLQFDVYQRYALLGDVLRASLGTGSRRVLDIGAGPERITERFLSDDWTVIPADVRPTGATVLPIDPAGPLPFADRSCDVVVLLDVLEHVSATRRRELLNEARRIATELVVVSHPESNARIKAAESLLSATFRALFRYDLEFLEEHRRYGLPQPGWSRGELQARGLHVVSAPTVRLVDWLPLTALDLMETRAMTEQDKRLLNRRANAIGWPTYSTGLHYRTTEFGCCNESVAVAAEQTIAALRARAEADNGASEDLALLCAQGWSRLPTHFDHSEDHAAIVAEVVRVKDRHITGLEQLLADMNQRLADAHAAIEQKDAYIAGLEVAAGLPASTSHTEPE